MFLNKLIARAEGTAPVLQSAPPLARTLDDPTWGRVPPLPMPEPEDEMLPAARIAARPRPPAREPRATEPEPGHDATPRTAPTDKTPQPAPPRPPAATPAARPAQPALVSAAALPRPVALQPANPAPPPEPAPRRSPAAAPRPPAAIAAAATPQAMPQRPTTAPPPLAPLPAPHPFAAPAPPRATPDQPERIEVHIDIGHLDLVSIPARVRAAPKPTASRPGPGLSLTDYLDRRRGDRR